MSKVTKKMRSAVSFVFGGQIGKHKEPKAGDAASRHEKTRTESMLTGVSGEGRVNTSQSIRARSTDALKRMKRRVWPAYRELAMAASSGEERQTKLSTLEDRVVEVHGAKPAAGLLGELPGELRNEVYENLDMPSTATLAQVHPLYAAELKHTLFVGKLRHEAGRLGSVDAVRKFEADLRTVPPDQWEQPLMALAFMTACEYDGKVQEAAFDALLRLSDEIPAVKRGRLAHLPRELGQDLLAASWEMATPEERDMMAAAKAHRDGDHAATGTKPDAKSIQDARMVIEYLVLGSNWVHHQISANADFATLKQKFGISNEVASFTLQTMVDHA